MADLEAGATFDELVVDDLTRTRIVQYAGASGDFNPLHTDERYATEVAGEPGVFAHGMLTMGLTASAVGRVVGAPVLRRFGGRFTAKVWPGDTLRARIEVLTVTEGGAELAVTTTNQHGQVVFTGAAAVDLSATSTSAS